MKLVFRLKLCQYLKLNVTLNLISFDDLDFDVTDISMSSLSPQIGSLHHGLGCVSVSLSYISNLSRVDA